MRSAVQIDEVIRLVNAANWYHSYEVVPGVITPGNNFTNAVEIFDTRYSLPQDLSGKTALDIGTLDGPYAFEMERRGAKVTAMDIQHPDRTGFNTAKRVRGSSARYIQGSVYDLGSLLDQQFDIVTFFGVWYHLKNPVAAFEQLHRAVNDDGMLLFEGECFKSFAQLASGHPVEDLVMLRSVADSQIPVALYYSGAYKGDEWSWFVPNAACVGEWLATAGFEITAHGFWDDHPHQRMYGSASKRPSFDTVVDNPVW